MRVDRSYRTVRGGIVILGVASLLLTFIPATKDLAWSALLGLLLGGLNFHLLLSGLRRALRLHPGTAHGSFQVASFFRLVVVGGLLLWAAVQGPRLLAWPVLGGFFLPEILFFIEFYRGAKEESP